MAKYHVQCGDLARLIAAEDPAGAALWTLHQFLSQRAPGEPPGHFAGGEVFAHADPGLATQPLPGTVAVCEVGFARDEPARLDTGGLLAEWKMLAGILDRLGADCVPDEAEGRAPRHPARLAGQLPGPVR